MEKMLILTEKPSVARDFARALNLNQKADGYIEGTKAIVTWAFGHLLESAPPDAYSDTYKKWRLDDLPIIPDAFRFLPKPESVKQLKIITTLANRSDIDGVIIATDAGREGEVIARLILNYSQSQKKQYRFWTSQALTKEIISYGLNKGLKKASEFDRIWRAGYQRTKADWLVGMNLSRCASLTIGGEGVYSVGRVQTAVLSLLVDRRNHREHFKPEPYWIFKCTFENEKGIWVGTWFKGDGKKRETKFFKREAARAVALKVKGQTGSVIKAKKSKKKKSPPFLYSLTVLQREANRKYGYTAQKTLDTAQSLYEKHQAISYPRTDAEVLGSKNVGMVKGYVKTFSAKYPDLFNNVQSSLIKENNKRVFNDSKLTDHHAMIPLKIEKESFSDAERKIFGMILIRFAAVFHPDYEYEATEIVTSVKGETFLTRGNITLNLGFKALYKDTPDKEAILPPLKKGDEAHLKSMAGEEKQTTPLAEYTEDTLLNDMSNPAKYVEERDLKAIYKGDIGLGTQSTRAQIIETLLKRAYAKRDKKKIIAREKGCALISFLRALDDTKILASPKETAQWEKGLNAIAFGETNDHDFEKQIEAFIKDSVKEFKSPKAVKASAKATAAMSRFGICPVCGSGIIETPKAYSCSAYRLTQCAFAIWKTIAKKKISAEIARELLTNGKTGKAIKGFKSKKGSAFDAALILKRDEKTNEVTVGFLF